MANHKPKHAGIESTGGSWTSPVHGLAFSGPFSRDATARGFTLIELLVVIFIISIVTSVALLSVGRNENKRLESFTNELVQMVTLAEEQAMLQPVVLGLSLGENSYQFSSYHAVVDKNVNPWMPFKDRVLGAHNIPNDIQVSVVMNGKLSSDSDDNNDDPKEKAKNNIPQIVISTNGDVTPFTIYIGKRGQKPRYVINGDADGNVTSRLLS